MYENHSSIILGETGKGKSTFINAIFGYKVVNTSDSSVSCTKDLNQELLTVNQDHFIFIDTPGLNDGDKNQEKKTIEILRTESTSDEASRIKCIILVVHIDDKRFTNSLTSAIKEFMNCFPLDNFWEHVLIIQTHARTEKQKNKKKGKILQSILNDTGLISYMNEKKIKVPQNLKEIFVNSVNDDDEIIDIENEKKEILKFIKSRQKIFKSVIKSPEKTKTKNGIKYNYIEITYEDFNSNISTKEQITCILSNDGIYKEEKYGGVYTKCGKKYQKYQRYFIQYDNDGNIKNKIEVGEAIPRRV